MTDRRSCLGGGEEPKETSVTATEKGGVEKRAARAAKCLAGARGRRNGAEQTKVRVRGCARPVSRVVAKPAPRGGHDVEQRGETRHTKASKKKKIEQPASR